MNDRIQALADAIGDVCRKCAGVEAGYSKVESCPYGSGNWIHRDAEGAHYLCPASRIWTRLQAEYKAVEAFDQMKKTA